MATGLERPPWDTSKQSFDTVSPADKENREFLRQLFASSPGTGPGPGPDPDGLEAAISGLIASLPTSWVGLPVGALWNNGGIVTRVGG